MVLAALVVNVVPDVVVELVEPGVVFVSVPPGFGGQAVARTMG